MCGPNPEKVLWANILLIHKPIGMIWIYAINCYLAKFYFTNVHLIFRSTSVINLPQFYLYLIVLPMDINVPMAVKINWNSFEGCALPLNGCNDTAVLKMRFGLISSSYMHCPSLNTMFQIPIAQAPTGRLNCWFNIIYFKHKMFK